jgi:hypothetical protein
MRDESEKAFTAEAQSEAAEITQRKIFNSLR